MFDIPLAPIAAGCDTSPATCAYRTGELFLLGPSNMTEFYRLGFDIRRVPEGADIFADALTWPQEHAAYRSALSAGFKENSFELIQIDSASELDRLNEIVHSTGAPAVIVELAAFGLVANSQSDHWIDASLDTFTIDSRAITMERYDACDLDGFFSAFAMGLDSLQRGRGCSTDELLDACIIAQAANFLVPSHAPFVTVRVRVLQTR